MAYTDAQGIYSYLKNGGMLCPLLVDDLTVDAKKGLASYIRDFGDESIWLEEDEDCEDSQRWENR